MKIIIIILFFLSYVNAFESSFLEDNEFHLFDSFYGKSNIDEETFKYVIDTVKSVYDDVALEHGHKLTIYGNWRSKTVNAYCQRQYKKTIISVMGGIARRPELTSDGLALIICHELGHAYGGKPHSRRPLFLISYEGQADYYGAKVCLHKVLTNLIDFDDSPSSDYVANKCKDDQLCIRKLNAVKSVGKLLSVLKDEPEPDFLTPDPYKTRRTIRSYPKTVQCRFDTYVNGIFNLNRPSCWYR